MKLILTIIGLYIVALFIEASIHDEPTFENATHIWFILLFLRLIFTLTKSRI